MLSTIRRRILDRLILRPSTDPIEPAGGEMVRLDPLDPLAASELKHRDRYDGRIACLVHRGKDVEIVNPAKSDRGGEAAGTIVLKFPGNAGRAERSGPFALSAIGDPTGVCVT